MCPFDLTPAYCCAGAFRSLWLATVSPLPSRLAVMLLYALFVAICWTLLAFLLWLTLSYLPFHTNIPVWIELFFVAMTLSLAFHVLKRHWPSCLAFLPILVLEPFIQWKHVFLRAQWLTEGGSNRLLLAWLPVASLCAAVALAVSFSAIVCVEGLAHVLATRRNVYLRADQEEWVSILMIGLMTLFFGPALVALPLLSIHTTVLYINLRVQREDCTDEMLMNDLTCTVVNFDDDNNNENNGDGIKTAANNMSPLPSAHKSGLESRKTSSAPLGSPTPMLLLLLSILTCSTTAKSNIGVSISTFSAHHIQIVNPCRFATTRRRVSSNDNRQSTWATSPCSFSGAADGSISYYYSISGASPVPARPNDVTTWQRRISRQLPPPIWAALAGALSFGSTLGFSTTLQRLAGISTGTAAPFPSMVGLATVCFASTTAHQVALATHVYAATGTWPAQFTLWPRIDRSSFCYYDDDVLDLKIIQIPWHSIRIWAMGVVCFKLLGGRFWAIAPSSMTHLGSYARGSLPATERYATASQRLKIEKLGRFWGCHTCGSHRCWLGSEVQFVGDHMPPKSVAQRLENSFWYRLFRKTVNYRFYPQCMRCSSKQGSLLSKAAAGLRIGRRAALRLAAVGGSRAASYNHGWQPRFNHLTGALLGAIATVSVHPADLEDENRWRYATWQGDLLNLFTQRESEIVEHWRAEGAPPTRKNECNTD